MEEIVSSRIEEVFNGEFILPRVLDSNGNVIVFLLAFYSTPEFDFIIVLLCIDGL